MKILVCIAHYGNKQLIHLLKILTEYNSMAFKIDIAVFLTEDFDSSQYKNINIKKFFFDPEIRLMLVHQYKKFMAQNSGDYDLFIYSENDILITEAGIRAFIDLSKKLENTSFIPGFLRYEIKDDNYKYLIDYHSSNATARYGPFWMRILWLKNFIAKNDPIYKKYTIGGLECFEPTNLHSGFFALTKEQFKRVLDSGNFFKGPEGGFCGILESAAADVYYRCGLTKIISRKNMELFLIHHLPDKYVNELADKYNYNKTEVPDTKKLLWMTKNKP